MNKTPPRYRGNMVKRKSRTAKSVQPRYRPTVSPEQQIVAFLKAKAEQRKRRDRQTA